MYSDSIVVLLYLFSVLSQRSMCWAYEKRNWPLWMRHLQRPSYSQLMRRLRSSSFQKCMARLRDAIPPGPGPSLEKYLDGKPLVVGAHSKDKEARRGYVGRDTWARGYKLHAVVNAAGFVENATVTPLNEGEATVAKGLLEQMNLQGVTLLADANYDSNSLYETVANRGGRLLAPRRKPGRGLGKRTHHVHRLEAIAQLEKVPGAMDQHKADRNRIEQAFAHLTNVSFGLAPLPNFVRGLTRVTRWVEAKIYLFHLYLDRIRIRKEAA